MPSQYLFAPQFRTRAVSNSEPKRYWTEPRSRTTPPSSEPLSGEVGPATASTPSQGRPRGRRRGWWAVAVTLTLVLAGTTTGILLSQGSPKVALPLEARDRPDCASPGNAVLGQQGAQFSIETPKVLGKPVALNSSCAYTLVEGRNRVFPALSVTVYSDTRVRRLSDFALSTPLGTTETSPAGFPGYRSQELVHVKRGGLSVTEASWCVQLRHSCYGWALEVSLR